MTPHEVATVAVVLAGGQGKRMKSSRPKVLHDLLGKPIISRVLSTLDELRLEHIHIIVGHQGDQVVSYLQENPPLTPYTTHIQEPQLGTGHALMQVESALDGFAGTVLVLAGDTPLIRDSTLRSLLRQHCDQQDALTVLTTIVDDPAGYGRILRDDSGSICAIVEAQDAERKHASIHEINASVYCLEWLRVSTGLRSLTNTNRQKEFYLTDIVAWSKKNNLSVGGYASSEHREIMGVNSQRQLAQCATVIRDRKIDSLCIDHGVTVIDPQSTWIAPEVAVGADTRILPGCYLIGNIQIGSHCEIGPNSYIHGTVKVGNRTSICQSHVVDSQIGADCIVGPFAHLRGGTKIDANIWVGNFVELARTNVDKGTTIKHLSYLGDSNVGKGVNIGAGTITANYDSVTEQKSQTTLKDGVSTGSNSVLVAPVTIGEQAVVAAGTVVTEDVPAGALAVGRTAQQNKAGWVAEKKRRSTKTKTR